MYIQLNFLLTKKELSLEYRRNILSFFKKSLSDSDEKYFKEFYSNKKQKNFTWSSKMNVEKIENDIITLNDNKLSVNFSTNDSRIGFIFWNAFLKQRNIPFKIQNDNFLILTDISDFRHKKIIGNNVICKTENPLVLIRQDSKYNYKTNYFLSFEDNDFKDVFKQKTGLDITPIKCKKIWVRHYDINFPATTGIFMLSGPQDLLNKYYCSGIADKHSQGFGTFSIIQ